MNFSINQNISFSVRKKMQWFEKQFFSIYLIHHIFDLIRGNLIANSNGNGKNNLLKNGNAKKSTISFISIREFVAIFMFSIFKFDLLNDSFFMQRPTTIHNGAQIASSTCSIWFCVNNVFRRSFYFKHNKKTFF